MAQYNFYLMDSNDHIVGRHERDCTDDSSALLAAELLKSEFEIEVWQAKRLVGRLAKTMAKTG